MSLRPSLLVGSGTPLDSLGNLDDSYIDKAAPAFYGPKSAAGWGASVPLGGGELTYVDLSLSSVAVTLSSPTGLAQFDFSGFASQFAHKPSILNLKILFDFDLAANTDMAKNEWNDSDSAGERYSFDYCQFFSSVGGATDVLDQNTTFAQPFDFNGTTTFSVWLEFNPAGSITLNSCAVTVVGYYF